jgi:GT2 family glycosyltransferase
MRVEQRPQFDKAPPAEAISPDGNAAHHERTAWWDSFLADGQIDVSICIPNWNCRDLLRACLESLLDTPQGVRLEVIVADNGSEDGSAEMVATTFPEVVLLRNPANVGFARASNQAAGKAQGRYLLFLNNDTVVPPNTLRRLIDYATARPEVGLVGPALRDLHGQRQTSSRSRPTPATFLHRTCLLRWTNVLRPLYRRYRRRPLDPHEPARVDVLMGAALLMPRQLFLDCGRWDESFFFGGEDLDLCTRVARTHQIVYHPGIEVSHVGRASTRLAIGPSTTQIAVGFVRYLRKSGYSVSSLLVYKALMTLDAPLHAAAKALEYCWRRLNGRPAAAEKSLLVARGLIHFLTHGLPAFWRA